MLSRWISINQQEPLTRGALVIMFFSNIMVYSLNSNHLRNNRLCSASPRRFETNHDEVVYIINFEEIAYHQGKALYIIIAKELYSLRLMRYTLRVMIYSLTANDIPLLSQWIKKDDSEESSFLARRKGLDGLCPSFARFSREHPIVFGFAEAVRPLISQLKNRDHTKV